eukprot:scaffold13.g195.t1
MASSAPTLPAKLQGSVRSLAPPLQQANAGRCWRERRRGVTLVAGLAGAQGAGEVHAAGRRRLLLSAASALAAAATWQQQPATAVQGLTAGRIPGITGPDAEGYYTYQRPEGKSGGHGVGWSEIPRYSFRVPVGWEEVPVSIADLGGTEIDLRYKNPDEGDLEIVVAPILRFKDVGFNANVSLNELGVPPERIIAGFAPELYGNPLSEEELLSVKARPPRSLWPANRPLSSQRLLPALQVLQKGGRPYYEYELRGHRLVSATAVGNRLFMLAARCNSRQWRHSEAHLRTMIASFYVPPLA